jgi:hypothetical protein
METTSPLADGGKVHLIRAGLNQMCETTKQKKKGGAKAPQMPKADEQGGIQELGHCLRACIHPKLSYNESNALRRRDYITAITVTDDSFSLILLHKFSEMGMSLVCHSFCWFVGMPRIINSIVLDSGNYISLL